MTYLLNIVAIGLISCCVSASYAQTAQNTSTTGSSNSNSTSTSDPSHNSLKKSEEINTLPDQSLYHLHSKWITQSGAEYSLSDYKNKFHIMAMTYTNCQHTCPIIVNDLKKIEASLPAQLKNNTHFTLVSFDAENETVETLKKHSKKLELDLSRWTLITGQEDDVLELAAVLGVKFKKDKNGEFSHSNSIFLLDKEGVIRYRQDGLNQSPDAMVKTINRLDVD